ncbi:uncharacterized protein LOC119586694 [Penaeus monodon]|uniref:uncharacterized protein LOC119586694 n=1 Tax=Penaeus monodon TaxID=6687 RepID=UPI0018A76C04|nr:uncharacterized protein LOC119586694 [Penaeus monodon]
MTSLKALVAALLLAGVLGGTLAGGEGRRNSWWTKRTLIGSPRSPPPDAGDDVTEAKVGGKGPRHVTESALPSPGTWHSLRALDSCWLFGDGTLPHEAYPGCGIDGQYQGNEDENMKNLLQFVG